MDKIRGANLGNWLVLEKWMSPFIFDGTDAEDETWLNRDHHSAGCCGGPTVHRDADSMVLRSPW